MNFSSIRQGLCLSGVPQFAGFFAEMTRLRAISPKTPESVKKNLARVGAP
jgi:hypothetical protein